MKKPSKKPAARPPAQFEYTELSGRVLRCPAPDPATRAYLQSLMDAADDPKTTAEQMRALVFGPENPLLARHPTLPGAYPATETVKHPLYWVCVDLLQRVELRASGTSVERAAAPFTTSVSEAAEKLGRHRYAVHNAINNGTLHAWVHDGRLYLLPAEVATYDVPRRGRRPRSKE